MTIIIERIEGYLNTLDWSYIVTLLIICWTLTKDKSLTSWWQEGGSTILNKTRSFLLAIPKGIRVMVISLIYGIFIYHWRGYDKSHIETLFQSFIFLTAFYGLIISRMIKAIEKSLNGDK